MNIVTIGGGPGGLYSAILFKKAYPQARIRVLERNKRDDTFGWGVVFSDETLGNFKEADPESYQAILDHFAYWTDIETWYRGECVTSTGHGFCGMSRKNLLLLLQDRCTELGVELEYEHEVEDFDRLRGDADLLIAADGVNSAIRERYSDRFGPSLDWRKCKFAWFGTDLEMSAFTFVFKETPYGLFQVHAYPFEKGLGTWIVECHEDVWRAAGLDTMSEEESARWCEELFADDLKGHKLLTNRSMWRTFPTVSNRTWHFDNVVLLGDSAHTAHFSIGSGTKLAMEDAIALVAAFQGQNQSQGQDSSADGVPGALRAYEEARYVDVIKTQKAAQTSLEWFENSARYLGQDPQTFKFNLMTRSKRITWNNLALRDPALVAAVREAFGQSNGAPQQDGAFAVPIFAPLKLRDLNLPNRIVVSPMCQYSAVDGIPSDWHLVHLGSRAVGAAGLVITEMTNVSAEGRITPGCTGLWNDEQHAAWARIVRFVHEHSAARIGIQLAHAGRKGSVSHPWDGGADQPLQEGAWQTMAPSAEPFDSSWPAPKAMDRADMDQVRDAFVASTVRAEACGFDLIELHMAHGYLLSSFLSPLSNSRKDEYGGALENRARFPLEVFSAMREAWPAHKPLIVRISASDWREDGFTVDEAVQVSRWLKERGCDLMDVSSAGNSLLSKPVYGRMYQVPFAEQIRYEADIPVMAVGAIQGPDHANTVLAAGRADLCALARPHLADPYITLHAAREYGFDGVAWPGQYLAGKGLKPE